MLSVAGCEERFPQLVDQCCLTGLKIRAMKSRRIATSCNVLQALPGYSEFRVYVPGIDLHVAVLWHLAKGGLLEGLDDCLIPKENRARLMERGRRRSIPLSKEPEIEIIHP